MHCKEHSPFLSTDSAPSLIGSGNGSAPNSMQSNQNMVSPLLFHDQDTACPPFPQRKELVAQVARIYWPHLINATKVQPGSLFLSLHFITAFVIMQAPRFPFLEAHAILQVFGLKLWVLNYKFWYLVSVLGVLVLEHEYISFWSLLGPLGNATHWGRSRKCLAIVCLSNHLPLQSTRK